MCRFKSAIILEDDVFIPDYDSHTQMLNELGIDDTRKNSGTKFIRAELYPKNGDIFTDIRDWYFNVDQDTTPEWYVRDYDEVRMREAVSNWIPTRGNKHPNKAQLSSLKPGDTFVIGNVEYVVLDKENDAVSCLTTDLINNSVQFDLESNNFATSKIYTYLNDRYYKSIAGLIGEDNIVEHAVDLTSSDGLTDYGMCWSKISLLTLDQYKKYRDIIPTIDKYWWLSTPYSTPNGTSSHVVCCVCPYWDYYCGGYCYDGRGVRPFCIFKSSISVSC